MTKPDEQGALQVREFVEYYLDTLLTAIGPGGKIGVERFFTPEELNQAADELLRVCNSEGTIFTFGNGGSDAFADHFTYGLHEMFASNKFKIVDNPPNFIFESIASKTDYDLALAHTLEKNYSQDSAVVLFSASGNSNNVVAAAQKAGELGIDSYSFTGFDGGKLGKMTDVSFNSRIFDQQPAEDSNQMIMHILLSLMKIKTDNSKIEPNVFIGQYLDSVEMSLSKIDAGFLDKLSLDISRAYCAGKKVFVYAPEGGALGISASHIAHNLQWDAIMNVENHPAIQVNGPLLAQQYTGVANDFTAIQLEVMGRTDVFDGTYFGKYWAGSFSISDKIFNKTEINPDMLEVGLKIERAGEIIYNNLFGTSMKLRGFDELPDLIIECRKKFENSPPPSKKINIDDSCHLPEGTVILTGTILVVPPKCYSKEGDKITVYSPQLGELVNVVQDK